MARSKLFLITAALLAVPGFFGAVAYYDASRQPELTFEPVREPSALDERGASWTTPAPGEEGETQPTCDGTSELPRRWLVVGWDGADWQFLLPLLEQGRLPHLESLLLSGSYGTLASIVPTLSPAI